MSGSFAALVAQFPDTGQAGRDGLLCAGGDLRPERLLAAYSLGIFPWYGQDDPILWWSPAPRCILPLEKFHLPRRSARYLRNHPFELTCDKAFATVIRECAQPRKDGGGTWLTEEMIAAYTVLHQCGYAHSIEAWKQGSLVGGLYGVSLGRAFFGESMFHRQPEASRAALAGLVALLRHRQTLLLDCQQQTAHIMGMGGVMISRRDFGSLLAKALAIPHGQTNGDIAGIACAIPWGPWSERYVYHPELSDWKEEMV